MIKLKKALDEEDKVIRLKMDIIEEQDREIKDNSGGEEDKEEVAGNDEDENRKIKKCRQGCGYS